MGLELLFLGTGTSAGVPMIGCQCAVCTSSDQRDCRDRTSALISYPDEHPAPDGRQHRRLLIDTAPELRLQMVRNHINAIDGVLYTHAHSDHISGIDDLRRFNAVMDAPIELYAERRVLDRFFAMFPYIFESQNNVNDSFVPRLVPIEIKVGQPIQFFGATWTPLRLLHGHLPILGFRVDCQGQSLAYCTDVSGIPPETYPLLENLDVLVLDALRYRHHPTHLTVDQAMEQIDHIAPRRAYLTHIAHEILHADLEAKLPANVHLSYDGLKVDCGSD